MKDMERYEMYGKTMPAKKERRDMLKNRIAELRKEQKMTQQALGEVLQVSRQTIISLENGKYNPSLTLAYGIAKVFGCTIEEVFLFEE